MTQPTPGREPNLIALRLVPVEAFTGLCDHEDCPDPDHLGYGLSDAVEAWSDCNRAAGRVYRVDDMNPALRKPGDTVTVYVDAADVEWFSRRFGSEGLMSGVGQGTGEPRFTLAEAQRELARQNCADHRHSPSCEIACVGDRAGVWLCECGEYTYTPSRRS